MEKKSIFWVTIIGVILYLGYKLLNVPKATPESKKDEDDRPNSIDNSIIDKIDLSKNPLPIVEVEVYNMEYITIWFKNQINNNRKLLSNASVKAFALSPKAIFGDDWETQFFSTVESNNTCFIQGFFDVESEEISLAVIVSARDISNEITEMFEDKPLLILK